MKILDKIVEDKKIEINKLLSNSSISKLENRQLFSRK